LIDSNNLAVTTVRGAFWGYAANYSGKTLSFFSTIVLAWLLTRDDFGLAGYALVVISILEVMQDLGVGPALIYIEENPDATDTAFWLSIITGVGLFLITWWVSPTVGRFFSEPRAVSLTRALGLAFPISSFSTVHASLLQKKLRFGRHFIPELSRSISKGLVSIILALLGFGAWSLVLGLVAGRTLSVIAYWIVMPWRPTLRFERNYAKKLLTYGFDIISLNAVGALLSNIDYILIGRFLGTIALGVYKLAFIIPEYLINQITSVLGGVIFPIYTKLRDDAQMLNQAFIETVRYVAFVVIPMGLGLALVAEPMVLTFFSEKWQEAIPIIRAISIYAMVNSLGYGTGAIFKAQGKVKYITILAIVRVLVMIPFTWYAIHTFGTIEAVAWAQVGVVFISRFIKMSVVWMIVRFSVRAVLKIFVTMGMFGIVMSFGVYGVLLILDSCHSLVQLIVGILVGAIIYVGGFWIFDHKFLLSTAQVIKNALKSLRK